MQHRSHQGTGLHMDLVEHSPGEQLTVRRILHPGDCWSVGTDLYLAIPLFP